MIFRHGRRRQLVMHTPPPSRDDNVDMDPVGAGEGGGGGGEGEALVDEDVGRCLPRVPTTAVMPIQHSQGLDDWAAVARDGKGPTAAFAAEYLALRQKHFPGQTLGTELGPLACEKNLVEAALTMVRASRMHARDDYVYQVTHDGVVDVGSKRTLVEFILDTATADDGLAQNTQKLIRVLTCVSQSVPKLQVDPHAVGVRHYAKNGAAYTSRLCLKTIGTDASSVAIATAARLPTAHGQRHGSTTMGTAGDWGAFTSLPAPPPPLSAGFMRAVVEDDRLPVLPRFGGVLGDGGNGAQDVCQAPASALLPALGAALLHPSARSTDGRPVLIVCTGDCNPVADALVGAWGVSIFPVKGDGSAASRPTGDQFVHVWFGSDVTAAEVRAALDLNAVVCIRSPVFPQCLLHDAYLMLSAVHVPPTLQIGSTMSGFIKMAVSAYRACASRLKNVAVNRPTGFFTGPEFRPPLQQLPYSVCVAEMLHAGWGIGLSAEELLSTSIDGGAISAPAVSTSVVAAAVNEYLNRRVPGSASCVLACSASDICEGVRLFTVTFNNSAAGHCAETEDGQGLFGVVMLPSSDQPRNTFVIG